MHAHKTFYFFVSCLVGCSQTTSFSFVSNPTFFFRFHTLSYTHLLLNSQTINTTTDFLELHSICLRTRIRADFFPFCIRSGKTSLSFFFPPLCRTHTPYTNQKQTKSTGANPFRFGTRKFRTVTSRDLPTATFSPAFSRSPAPTSALRTLHVPQTRRRLSESSFHFL